jgi:NADH:ubiquinone oxidoreductase subunit F (NADH-binding)/(2Fe-2S) ferredoxin/Pyruvate/2-oxoacid:ferredoxin oxidoreductase delta subunit
MSGLKSRADLEKLRQAILSGRDPARRSISVCAGTGCLALGCRKVIAALRDEVQKQGLEGKVEVKETGCPGFCEKGTVVVVYPQGICYLKVTPDDASEVVSETVAGGKVIDHLLYIDPVSGQQAIHEREIPFYQKQMRLLLGNNSRIDPKNIDDYIALGGYDALAKVLFEMNPQQVIEEVRRSGLRGRGGGGFPVGRKWQTVRDAISEPKYVVVNCDEGDPGAFMDRALMEGNPHSVLEGLAIAAYALGSHEGFIYVRAEYPLAVGNAAIAIQQAENHGLLGENILGSGFGFGVKIHRGAGAFVSGESSALMTAIEGRVGEPRPKYVHTSEKGVWSKPTCLNNVETLANVPVIINRGADWYSGIGTEGSKGTKIFSLVGKVNNTGLVEVPMGISLRDIVYGIGGGVPEGKKLKAVQTGGPSGGCIPERLLDSGVDFDELSSLGSMMGSGGMIVMDEDTCMVDTARYFLDFLADESCGKCTPCREGIRQMLGILTRICEGRGKDGDIELLEELSVAISETSLCALGATAPNPVLTTIQYFRDEYEAHIRDRRCPAYVCRELISYYIDPARCQACLICLRNCPAQAISGGKDRIHVIDQSRCTRCGNCLDLCPARSSAVRKISGQPVPPSLPEEDRLLVRGEE